MGESRAARALRGRFRGRLIDPHDPDYDDARRIWNGGIDRRPALIARCTGAADVQAAVRWGREEGLLVAIRGGGHNVAGTALCDDGLVIDLSGMKKVEVDPAARRARAEPGLLWGEFDAACLGYGLATTGGVVSHTGVAGLTVGGGIGWLMRKHGLTSDNLAGADLVTAEGDQVFASDDENGDLFWGLQGGGGNFGVVTSFDFRLHPVGPDVMAGPVLYPAARAAEVMRAYRDVIAEAPTELGTVLQLRNAPSAPWIPEEHHGAPVLAVAVCYAGPIEEGERVVAPLRSLGPALVDAVAPRPYAANQGFFDGSVPHGLNYYWKSHYAPPLSDAAIDSLIDWSWRAASPLSFTIIFHMGGAVNDRPDDASAFTGRDALHAVNINAATRGPQNEDVGWARGFFDAFQPHSTGGVYMNFLGSEGQDRVRAAYGEEKYRRLVELKTKYDPANFFRLNQNIEPRTAPGA
jgi:FAD/FMN-containing dehydrogenase